MRALLSFRLICLVVISCGIALSFFGLPGCILGAAMIATALCGPELWIACGWAVRCSPAGEVQTTIPEEPEPGPWWNPTVGPLPAVLLMGLGGTVVGCSLPVYLNEWDLHSFLVSMGVGGILGSLMAPTVILLDEQHPLHTKFMASVRLVAVFTFVVLLACGFWQEFSGLLRFTLFGGMVALVLQAMGLAWGLGLLVRALVRKLRSLCRSDRLITGEAASLDRW